jgi:hypothetical protein
MNGFEMTLPFLKPIEHLIPDDPISEAMALARGDDPEEVIRCIADYCGDHKHSGYARYTVEQAQAEIERAGRAAGPMIKQYPEDNRFQVLGRPQMHFSHRG